MKELLEKANQIKFEEEMKNDFSIKLSKLLAEYLASDECSEALGEYIKEYICPEGKEYDIQEIIRFFESDDRTDLTKEIISTCYSIKYVENELKERAIEIANIIIK